MICQDAGGKNMFNKDLREYAKKKNVFFWQVARKFGFSEPTMTRKLRQELSEAEKEKYRNAIDEIAAQKA